MAFSLLLERLNTQHAMHLGANIKVGFFDSFAVGPFTGNQAVVVSGVALDDQELLAIAKEFMLPETVALDEAAGVTRFRFATSDGIIAQCGHGTLAGIAQLTLGDPLAAGQRQRGRCRIEQRLLDWEARIWSETEATVSLEWPRPPSFCGSLPMAQLAEALRLRLTDLDDRWPVAVYDSGNRNGLVPLKDEATLRRAAPDYPVLEKLFFDHRLVDLHLYVVSREDSGTCSSDLLCRNLFPYGVREESATGTASLSLASALIDHQAKTSAPWENAKFLFDQGVGPRRGRIEVIVRSKHGAPPSLHLVGQVFKIASGQLFHKPKPDLNR